MSPGRSRLLWAALAALVGGLAALVFWRWVWLAPEGRFAWEWAGVQHQLGEPRALGLLLAAPLLVYALGRSLADLPWQQRVLALLARLSFLAALALALARPVRTTETHEVATVAVVDVSDSVPEEALGDALAALEGLRAARRADDELRLVTFARHPRLVEVPREGPLPSPRALRHPKAESDGTAIQAALELAYGVFPPGALKRAVLLSDGLETSGDLLAEAGRARRFGVRLHVRPYRRPVPAEVAVRELRVPDKVQIGEPFELVADVYASRKTHARARLYQGEMLNGLDGVRQLALEPGHNEVRLKSVVRLGGAVTYALALDELGADTFPANNRVATSVEVPGRPSVLYVEGQPQRATYLASALGAQLFDVDVRAATAFPGSLQELERYDFVILSDVPAEAVGPGAQDLIERYVRDLGGGFLFAGGENGFGLGGWAHTTLERILPVRMDAERRKEMPGVAMALVIDRSGSMTGLPLEMAKAACGAAVGTLQGDDLVEVIAFDSAPNRFVKLQPARYRTRIQNDIASIQPGGGTEIFSALDAAFQDMSVVAARKKHVILLTDGRAETQGIKELVQSMLAESITVTSVGLGEGADADLLRMVADAGGGRYHHVPDPNSLPRIFTRETEMVSRQAAVEDWFPVTQTAPADFLRGVAIGSAPLLHGYVATQMKGAPAQQILSSDQGEPILARMRLGLGQTLAWTSDVKNLWAADWLRWAGFGQFWGQLVREHMRKKHQRELPMHAEVVDGRLHATVDAFTRDERFDNALEPRLRVTGPEPKGERRELPMRQTAPGRYEADLRLDAYGSFRLEVEHLRKNADGEPERVGVSYGHVSNPYPTEYASFEPDLDRLARAAAVGGGSVDPDPARVFDPAGEKLTTQEPLWSKAILASLALFLMDLLVRRVRLFDRKLVAARSQRSAGRARAR